MRVSLLHNTVSPEAAPDEADVLIQVEAVRRALTALGHQVTVCGCDLDLAALERHLLTGRPDAVFNLVESLAGHGRLIHLVPSLVQALGIPLAGCPGEAMLTTSHKTLAKSLLRRAGLPTPDWLESDGIAGPAAVADRWIVKSIWEDASLGLDDDAVTAGGPDAARRLLAARTGTPGTPWFAEAFVEGREFNIALLDGPDGPTVLPHAEMLFPEYPEDKPRIVGYAAKWHPGSFEYGHTVRTFELPATDAPLLAEMTALSRSCWKLFGLRGWARVDFRIDPDGRPWILEVNVNPCLAPDAGFAAALARTGISFDAAVARILAAAA